MYTNFSPEDLYGLLSILSGLVLSKSKLTATVPSCLVLGQFGGADVWSPSELGPGRCRSLGVIVMLIDVPSEVRPARVSTARSASSSGNDCVHIFSSGYLFDSISRRAGSYARRS